MTTRRSFIRSLGVSLFAAPAIVRVASIMPVKAIVTFDEHEWVTLGYQITKEAIDQGLYSGFGLATPKLEGSPILYDQGINPG